MPTARGLDVKGKKREREGADEAMLAKKGFRDPAVPGQGSADCDWLKRAGVGSGQWAVDLSGGDGTLLSVLQGPGSLELIRQPLLSC